MVGWLAAFNIELARQWVTLDGHNIFENGLVSKFRFQNFDKSYKISFFIFNEMQPEACTIAHIQNVKKIKCCYYHKNLDIN